jgi:hypothetical protein
MRGCWALMLRFPAAVDLSFDAAFVNEGPLRWIARDSSKPGRCGSETWLLHASAEWSEEHLEADPSAVAAELLRVQPVGRRCGASVDSAPLALRRHRADHKPRVRLACRRWCRPVRRLAQWREGGRCLAQRQATGERGTAIIAIAARGRPLPSNHCARRAAIATVGPCSERGAMRTMAGGSSFGAKAKFANAAAPHARVLETPTSS